jgi:hypothetical protein
MKIIKTNDELIRLCRDRIIVDIGSIKNLPPKLRNSIASFYYNFIQFSSSALVSGGQPGFPDAPNPQRVLQEFIKDVAWWTATAKAIPGFVKDLQEIDRTQQPRLYDYTVYFINDLICYDVGKLIMLPPILRKPLLLLKRRKFQEIPGLVESIMKTA